MEQLKELKSKGERDKEALKKAIRAQKERAERSEEYAEQLNVQLAEKVMELGTRTCCCCGDSAFWLTHRDVYLTVGGSSSGSRPAEAWLEMAVDPNMCRPPVVSNQFLEFLFQILQLYLQPCSFLSLAGQLCG